MGEVVGVVEFELQAQYEVEPQTEEAPKPKKAKVGAPKKGDVTSVTARMGELFIKKGRNTISIKPVEPEKHVKNLKACRTEFSFLFRWFIYSLNCKPDNDH